MNKYYYLTHLGPGIEGFRNVVIHKPDPDNPNLLIERCVWCNWKDDDQCPGCGEWEKGITSLKSPNLKYKEITEEDFFIEMLETKPFSDY